MNPTRKQMLISGRPHEAQTWRANGIEIGNNVAVRKGPKVYIGRLVSIRYKNQKSKRDTRFPFKNIMFGVNENVEFLLFQLHSISPSGTIKECNSTEYFEPLQYKQGFDSMAAFDRAKSVVEPSRMKSIEPSRQSSRVGKKKIEPSRSQVEPSHENCSSRAESSQFFLSKDFFRSVLKLFLYPHCFKSLLI
jgi:hypothetical protein